MSEIDDCPDCQALLYDCADPAPKVGVSPIEHAKRYPPTCALCGAFISYKLPTTCKKCGAEWYGELR